MFRSLFLFDMTFWLYLAALTLYVGYILAKRPGVQLAAAGHPASGVGDEDGAFAMAGGLGVMYLLKERAERRGSRSSVFAAFPDLETIDELGYKAIMVGFPLLAFGVILGAMWANYAWGGYWSWDPKETWSLIVWLIYGAYIHARMTRGWEGRRAAIYSIFGFLMVVFCFWGVNFLLSGLHAYA